MENSATVAWVILNTAKSLKVGKFKLAAFLKGSKEKEIAYLRNEEGYGGLMWHNLGTIVGFIEQLENMELLGRKEIDPVTGHTILEPTDAGGKVLEQKIDIPLQIIVKERPKEMNDSERVTYGMILDGKTPEEVAKERNLAISTVYDHCHHLVQLGSLSSSAFIPEKISEAILHAIAQSPKFEKLSALKERLSDSISYGEIKCVLADKAKMKGAVGNNQNGK